MFKGILFFINIKFPIYYIFKLNVGILAQRTNTKKFSFNGELDDTGDTLILPQRTLPMEEMGEGQFAPRFHGDINEIVIVNSELSTFDRQRLEGYFAHKYGLLGLLPATHPFKINPPLA